MGTPGPPASKIAPNGDPYTSLLFLDFNSMYLWSQEQDLPLSPGLHWKLVDGRFRKEVMVGQVSFSAMQWLYYQQTKYETTIHHAYFQGLHILH